MYALTRYRIGLGLLALVVSTAMAATIVASVGMPEISYGDNWSDGYFTGSIDVSATYEDPLFGIGSAAEVTLAACASGSCPTGDTCATGATWESAELTPGMGAQTALSGARDAMYADVAALQSGGWVAVYQVEGSSWEVYAQLLNADGSTNGSAIPIFNVSSADQRQPRVAGLAGGGFAAVWVEDDGDDIGVFAQVLDDAGNAVSYPVFVNEEGIGRQHAPAVSASDSGDFLVAWTTGWDPAYSGIFDDDGKNLDVVIRTFDSSGNPIGGEDQLPTTAALDHESWAAVTDVPGAGWIGAWKAYNGQPPAVFDVGIEARSISYTQRGGSSYTLDYSGEITEARHLRMATAPDGQHYIATWEMSLGSQRAVRARVFDTSMVGVDATFAVDSSSHDQLRPAVTFVDDATALLVWAEVQSSGEGRVMAQAVDLASGATLGSAFRVDDDSAMDVVAAPAVARQADGSVLVTWSARSGSTEASSTVYSRLLEPRGTITATDVQHGDQDIDVQFRWTDSSGVERCSQVASWSWADPSAGSVATVNYLDGPTNATELPVDGSFSPGPESQLLSLDLESREASLSAGACGTWGAWLPEDTGLVPALTVQEQAELSDTSCVQYRWVLTNRARITFEHSSSAITRVDRVPPIIDSLQLDVKVDELVSTVASSDEHIGLGRATVSFSGGGELEIDPNGLSITPGLQDGPQIVRVTVYDLAENTDLRNKVVVADLAAPAVDILSIEDGDVVADGVPLIYAVQGDVVTLSLEVDGSWATLSETLSGLSEGTHMVTLLGETSDSVLVSDTVTFTIDNSVITAVLTAPGPQRYEDDEIVASWWVSDSTAAVELSLDGGSYTADPVFTGLADGPHVLSLRATTSDGRRGTDTVSFETEDVVPELFVEQPLSGQTLSTGTPQVICTASVNDIRWEVDGRSGTMSCGERIPNDGVPLGDGAHELFVTAVHENGNSVTAAIDLTIDTRPFELVVESPVEGLYADTSIPLRWTTTTDTAEVLVTLNGEEVDELVDLEPGRYKLSVSATALTGSSDTEIVNFVVAPLEILSPAMGQQVASPELPPEVPLVLAGGDDCASVTASVDGGTPQVITAPSGEVTSLPVDRGAHSIRVSCEIGERSLSRVVDFEIGEINIALGDGALRYSFDNCTDSWECDVTMYAILTNIGDFDAPTPFSVRFDHLNQDGQVVSDSQVLKVEAMAKGESTSLEFAPVRAFLEDRLSVFIDPDSTIAGETAADNYHEVRFLGASLNPPSWVHGASNTFISGAPLTNGLVATTSGAVQSLRVTAGDLVIVDELDDAGTWHALSDMGRLSVSDDCVEIAAVTEDDVVVDTQTLCPTVVSAPILQQPVEFPWHRYAQDGVVNMASLQLDELMQTSYATTLSNMADNIVSLVPVINSDGTISYTLIAMVGDPNDPLDVEMGDAPIVGGTWQIPSQTIAFAVSLNVLEGSCDVQGSLLTYKDGFALINEQLNGSEDYLNGEIADAFNSIDIEDMISDYANLHSAALPLPVGGNTFLLANALAPSRKLGYFGFYSVGIFDYSLNAPTFELANVSGDWTAGLGSSQCAMGFKNFQLPLEVSASMQAQASVEAHLLLEGQSMDWMGVAMVHWNWIPIPFLFGMGHASAEIYPQDIGMYGLAELQGNLVIELADSNVTGSVEGAVKLASETDYRPLASASVLGYTLVGYGYGQDYRTNWMTDGYGLVSAGGDFDFAAKDVLYDAPSAYSRFYLNASTERRSRHCFLWWCSWSDWSEVATISECRTFGDEALQAADPCDCDQYSGPEPEPERKACMSGDSVPFEYR